MASLRRNLFWDVPVSTCGTLCLNLHIVHHASGELQAGGVAGPLRTCKQEVSWSVAPVFLLCTPSPRQKSQNPDPLAAGLGATGTRGWEGPGCPDLPCTAGVTFGLSIVGILGRAPIGEYLTRKGCYLLLDGVAGPPTVLRQAGLLDLSELGVPALLAFCFCSGLLCVAFSLSVWSCQSFRGAAQSSQDSAAALVTFGGPSRGWWRPQGTRIP